MVETRATRGLLAERTVRSGRARNEFDSDQRLVTLRTHAAASSGRTALTWAGLKLILKMPGSASRQVDLGDFGAHEIRLGRASTNEIVLDDGRVSRVHAMIKIEGAVATIIDLDSSNGIKVNGYKVRSQVLQAGDRITIGSTDIRCLGPG